MPETDMRSEATFDEESELINYVLEHALRLEAIARRLLIDSLPRDSLARTILLADREVQLRDVQAVGGDPQKLIRLGTEEDRLIGNDLSLQGKSPTAGSHDNLDAIRRYRETFAGLVAGGARLQKLEGDERLIFERTRRAERLSTLDSQPAEDESRISSTQHKDKEKGYVLDLPLGEALRQKKRILKAVIHAEKDLSKAYGA
jgi:potassium channel subfamily K